MCAIDKICMMCNNFAKSEQAQASNIGYDVERDLVAQSGNYQRAVGRCETVARAVSEFPSRVGRSKPDASKLIRVRPLQRRSIQPARSWLTTGRRVLAEAVVATLPRNKVVTRKLRQSWLNFSSLYLKDKAGSFFVPFFRGCYPLRV